jgi:hypothetical protein
MNPGLSIFGVYPGRIPDLARGFAPETVPLDHSLCIQVESPPLNPIKHSHCWLLSLPSPAERELRSSLALILVARGHGGKFQVIQQKRSKGSYRSKLYINTQMMLRFSPPMIMMMTDTAYL